ncbi:MAG: cupredoxin domain-containing protein [Myxococcales bacterium]|jgi:plastocyanin
MPPCVRRLLLVLAAVAVALTLPADAAAQAPLRQTPNIPNGLVGIPWDLSVQLPLRFTDTPADGVALRDVPTLSFIFSLPLRLSVGARYSPSSTVVEREIGELEFFGRFLAFEQDAGSPVDAALQAGYNTVAGSLDGELRVSRRFGPVEIIGIGRGMTDAFGEGEAGIAAGAGVVLMPLPRSASIAIVGDAIWLFSPNLDEQLVWSAGLQTGLPLTPLSVSLQVSNTQTTTLQGSTLPSDDIWVGLELALTVPTGSYFGLHPTKGASREATRVPTAQPARTESVEIEGFAFRPLRIVVPRGTTVVWTNRDKVLHTVTAVDGGFDSAVPPDRSFRLTFDQPGTYPYNCEPHPFMRGVVVVK